MRDIFRWPARCVALLTLIWSWPAAAAPCASVSRSNLVRCAHAARLERQAGKAAVRAATGRVQATDPWLASNPALDLSGSRRRGPTESTLNWSASLGVELEIAGQRGARRSAALADREAQQNLVGAVERATAVEAIRLYFEVLAAREEQRVLGQMEAAATRVWEAAHAAAERGAAAGIEADVADAARVSTQQHKLEATRDERAASASLASLLGLSPTTPLDVAGALEPLQRAASVPTELSPPDFFGEMGLLTGEPRTATIVAKTDVVCWRIDKQAILDIIQARPEIAEALSKTLVQRRQELDAVRGRHVTGTPPPQPSEGGWRKC